MSASRSARLLGGLAVVVAGLAVAAPARAETLVAVTTTDQLAKIESDTPHMVRSLVDIAGLQPNEDLCGVDFRPSNGRLYAVGSSSRLYTIDTATGAATPVGQPGSFNLSGSFFGVDFNPVTDRLHVVSDSDQSLIVNPDTGALDRLGTPLAYGAGDPNQGQNPFITGLSHSNSVAGARTSAEYGIDSLRSILTRVTADQGTLTTVGSLGMNVGVKVGSDISGLTGVAYLSVGQGSSSTLATRNLETGQATPAGTVPLDLLDVSAETPRGYSLGDARASAFLARRGTITTRGITFNATCPPPDPFPEGADYLPSGIKCVIDMFLSIENPGSSAAQRGRSVVIARGRARLSGGQTRRVRVRLTRRGRRAVGQLRRTRVRSAVRANVRYRQPGLAEQRRTLRRSVTLRLRRRR
jgi:hypothetical protein